MRKKQIYLLTTWEVIDRYEDLRTEQFADSLTLADIVSVVVGDIITSDVFDIKLEWLHLVDDVTIEKVKQLTKITL